MAKVQIITDSSAYLPNQYVEQYGFDVIPLTLNWEGKSLRDGVDITAEEFYLQLKGASKLPTTSQVPVQQYIEHIKSALEKRKSVLILPISSGISASYQSALTAVQEFKGKPVEVLDTKLVSSDSSFMLLAVARTAEKGADLAECKTVAEEAYKHIGVYFTVDTLEYLYKGGRIGGAQRLMGAALKIKPILQIRNGVIDAAASAITRRKATERMVEMVKTAIGDKRPVRISVFHALEADLAKELLASLTSELHAEESILSEVSPVIGAHVGPGTVAIAWMAGM